MKEKQTIHVDQKIGQGAENNCYLREQSNGEISVIKVPNWLGRLWQTQSSEFLARCSEALEQLPIKVLQAKVHQDVEIVSSDRFSIETAPYVLEQEYVENLDEKTLDYGDLIDPEMGPKLMEILIKLLTSAEDIKQQHQLGLDLYGGAIIPEMLKGMFRRCLLLIADLIPSIGNKIAGVRGQVRNIILENGEIVLTDNGLFDFSKDSKTRHLVSTAYNVCIAGSIRLLEDLNRMHGECVDPSMIASIPYSGSKFEKWLGNFLLGTVMLPLYERYEFQLLEAHKKEVIA